MVLRTANATKSAANFLVPVFYFPITLVRLAAKEELDFTMSKVAQTLMPKLIIVVTLYLTRVRSVTDDSVV